MNKVNKPIWMNPAGSKESILDKIIDSLNGVIERMDEHDKMICNNTVWTAQAKGYSKNVVSMADRIEALEKHVHGVIDEVKNGKLIDEAELERHLGIVDIYRRIEALEKHQAELEEYLYPTQPLGTDCDTEGMRDNSLDAYVEGRMDTDGSWVCSECGKDWGDGSGLWCSKKPKEPSGGRFSCHDAFTNEGCGEVAVEWTPSPDTMREEKKQMNHEICMNEGKPLPSPDTEAPTPDELKPCPFCGSEAIVTHQDAFCTDCDLMISGFDEESKAITAWNTRPEEDRLKAENAELRDNCESLNKSCDKYEAENERLKEDMPEQNRQIEEAWATIERVREELTTVFEPRWEVGDIHALKVKDTLDAIDK